MTKALHQRLEEIRVELVEQINSTKTSGERNALGQFATPRMLADDIISFASGQLDTTKKIRFLEPGFGTGAFFAAVLRKFSKKQISAAIGFEKDVAFAKPASELYRDTILDLRLGDFVTQSPPQSQRDMFDLIVCNPPYVRHHHIAAEEKARLQNISMRAASMRLSGLAGLYCYFLAACHSWMKRDCVGIWLIPSEFMDVNYGTAVKQYLLEKVTLTRIHRFDPNDVQFADALVSSAIVCIRNRPPARDHKVHFSHGGSLREPGVSRMVPIDVLRHESKWTRFPLNKERKHSNVLRLGDVFQIRRGLATGDNKFFVLSDVQIEEQQLPQEVFRPLLPSPRYLAENEVLADNDGVPLLDQKLFLLDTKLLESEIKDRYPTLWEYLRSKRAMNVAEAYLCRHRKPWYTQENRPPAPIVCTYIGRSDNSDRATFRFIRNRSAATATNSYLMLYPKLESKDDFDDFESFLDQTWQLLNEIPTSDLLSEGRVYGGGMHKLEPKELANVPIQSVADHFDIQCPKRTQFQTESLRF